MLYIEDYYSAVENRDIQAPEVESKFVASGFPAASDDYSDRKLNLHDLLVKQPSATYFMRVGSEQYAQYSIAKNDLLVIDRSLSISAGRLIVAVVDGRMCIRRLVDQNGILCLSGKESKPLGRPDSSEACVWGVIAHIVRTLCRS